MPEPQPQPLPAYGRVENQFPDEYLYTSQVPKPKDSSKFQRSPPDRMLLHVEPTTFQHTSQGLAANLERLFQLGPAVLPFDYIIVSNWSGSRIAERLLGSHTLDASDRFVLMPLAEQPWFAHQALSTVGNFGPSAEVESIETSVDRLLAIVIIPADPGRFDRDFERVLRVAAPYDCEVTRFLRVVRAPMSARELGRQLLLHERLDRRDRFVISELRREPWFAHNAKSIADCERL